MWRRSSTLITSAARSSWRGGQSRSSKARSRQVAIRIVWRLAKIKNTRRTNFLVDYPFPGQVREINSGIMLPAVKETTALTKRNGRPKTAGAHPQRREGWLGRSPSGSGNNTLLHFPGCRNERVAFNATCPRSHPSEGQSCLRLKT